ncbi:MAG: DUF5110 domain-containing protein [Vallitaleaceae bacterium]|nr:DUF5110 domain-containing protein [Vallitaleaceae bacterium]
MIYEQIASGIWKATVGDKEALCPTDVVNALPKLERINTMDPIDFPMSLLDLKEEQHHHKIILSYEIDDQERFYGFGLQFMKVNHRGRTRFLKVNSDPIQDTGESHAPVPFYISTNGYGVFINTARIVTVHCGSTVRFGSKHHPIPTNQNENLNFEYTPKSDVFEIVVPSEGFEIYVFAGKSIKEIVMRYNLLFGGGTIPPKWGLGFWHRTPYKATDEEIIAEAHEYREKDFPCDVIGLETGWHSSSYPCTYAFHPDRFKDPTDFVKKLGDEGFKVNLWEHAYISPKSEVYESLKRYGCSHSTWGGLVPDYSIEAAREILKKQHKENHMDIGISGYKIDECDGSELTSFSWIFPAHSVFPSGNDGEQVRQMYGLLLQKLIYELYQKENKRTYGLVRASSGAATNLPYVLYSDLYDHKQFIRGLINSSFSGLLWTPEVRAGGNGEDYARRFQTVCFSPLAMINAWCDGTKPWTFIDVAPIIKKYLKLRMSLIPYFYNAFAAYHFDGLPPFRAMHFEEGFDPISVGAAFKAWVKFEKQSLWDVFEDELDTQYMAGDDLLIAPLFAGETKRSVYLPEGNWYDFYDGIGYMGGRFIEVSAALDKLPIFVRDGALIPMIEARDCMPSPGVKVALEVRMYGNQPRTFRLYDDDGNTYDYEKGQYQFYKIWTQINDQGQLEGYYDEALLLSNSYNEVRFTKM